jgi:uncharacterized membrane protein YfcA
VVVGGLIGTRIAKRLGTGGTLTTVFAVLIFVVAAYALEERGRVSLMGVRLPSGR